MRQDQDETTTKSARDNSPRVADIAARADHMARELAALAATPSQAAIVAQIARAALSRAFDVRVAS
ncbi:hypothetical protein SIL87_13825 [Acidiphilium acidophilum]|uniref:Uncharacterized protein n=1 Tax=Acidiphilium acidophilum TaxID=76588 RepID=A0AAW9DUX5_ACIAO|nr:hypothetical protein [Acidiphilium acidophilum]